MRFSLGAGEQKRFCLLLALWPKVSGRGQPYDVVLILAARPNMPQSMSADKSAARICRIPGQCFFSGLFPQEKAEKNT